MERFEIRLRPERRQELNDLARESGLSSAAVARLAIQWLVQHRELSIRGQERAA
jgi:hypothetical protein